MSALLPKKVTLFDRAGVVVLSDLLLGMLQVVAEQRGLTVTREKGQFESDRYTFSVTFRTQTAAGAPSNFDELAAKIGLTAGSWGRTFFYESDEYQIYDIRPKNRKYKVMVRRVFDEKVFKFPVGLVCRKLSDPLSQP